MRHNPHSALYQIDVVNRISSTIHDIGEHDGQTSIAMDFLVLAAKLSKNQSPV